MSCRASPLCLVTCLVVVFVLCSSLVMMVLYSTALVVSLLFGYSRFWWCSRLSFIFYIIAFPRVRIRARMYDGLLMSYLLVFTRVSASKTTYPGFLPFIIESIPLTKFFNRSSHCHYLIRIVAVSLKCCNGAAI